MTETTAKLRARHLGQASALACERLNRGVEWLCAAILGVLVIDVGVGIVGRYLIDVPVTWSEEVARYLMIWAALLAVSCGVARREHVAVTALLQRLPARAQRLIGAAIDILGFAFFAFLCYFGIGMTEQGASQYATVFEMTMWLPFAAVPVSSALVCLQLLLRGVRDFTLGTAPTTLLGQTR